MSDAFVYVLVALVVGGYAAYFAYAYLKLTRRK
jgi:hypothetical protein